MFDIILLQQDTLPVPKREPYLVLQAEAYGALDAICFEEWKSEKEQKFLFAMMEEVQCAFSKEFLAKCLPIGSIEFVEAVMHKAFGVRHIEPVNIPAAMNIKRFWKRRMAIASGAKAVQALFRDWNCQQLFIKSASRLKTDITGIYKQTDSPEKYDAEPLLLVSEVLPMTGSQAAEWRMFVYNGAIRDLRCYSGNPWSLPAESLCMEIALRAAQHYDACTVDVAVTDTGETAIIEIHNFISCGLYGASMPLSMYRRAYMGELRRQGAFQQAG